ncbi:MAG: pyridoxal phosphate-dependent aminotransferase, partial [candidate division WOR-3 bacterium]
MEISKRANEMPSSPIRKLASLADAAKKKGVSVYHLNIGQPDIETPAEIYKAIQNYKEKVLEYGPSGGLVELRLEIVNYFKDLGINIELDNVWITTGGSEAIIFAMMTVCDVFDEIIVFEPFYTNYNGFSIMAQIKLVPIQTRVEEGFHLPPYEKIVEKITPRTRAILICNPNNPTGTVYTEEELYLLSKIVKKYNLFLLADEVYREFTYDKRHHVSALELFEIKDRVIVMDSISKRFSACGARVGCLITRNKKVFDAVLKFGQARLCPPTLEQIGAIAAYKHINKYIRPMIAEYEHRRNILYDKLTEMEGVYCHKPEGAFYTVVRLPVIDADHFCAWLLTDFAYRNKTT